MFRRSWLVALVLPLLLGGGGRPVKGGDKAAPKVTVERHLKASGRAGIKMGEQRLKAGQYKLAIQRFKVELEADPTLLAAERGLALAHAGLKECDEAMPILERLRVTQVWDSDLATADGNCLLRASEDTAALAAFQEAVLFAPQDPDGWYGLAQAANELGELEIYDDAVFQLQFTTASTSRVRGMVASIDAWDAYRNGTDDDAWEALLDLQDAIAAAPRSTGAPLDAAAIEGLLWLEVGDLDAAEEIFHQGAKRVRFATRLTALRAEALRRSGDLDAGDDLLEMGRARQTDLAIKTAVQARILVDAGDIEAAKLKLQGAPLADPDIIASYWYVARADGNHTMMDNFAHMYAARPHGRDALDQLIPRGDL